jgi:hypothetical protein
MRFVPDAVQFLLFSDGVLCTKQPALAVLRSLLLMTAMVWTPLLFLQVSWHALDFIRQRQAAGKLTAADFSPDMVALQMAALGQPPNGDTRAGQRHVQLLQLLQMQASSWLCMLHTAMCCLWFDGPGWHFISSHIV